MKISVNGRMREVSARDIASILDELDIGGTAVATAVNGEFVPASARANQSLSNGDRLEILAPMQGG